MIQKAKSWVQKDISREDTINQAILEPELTRSGIKKIGVIKNRKKVTVLDFQAPKDENDTKEKSKK